MCLENLRNKKFEAQIAGMMFMLLLYSDCRVNELEWQAHCYAHVLFYSNLVVDKRCISTNNL